MRTAHMATTNNPVADQPPRTERTMVFTREAFIDYVRSFNTKSYKRQHSYYGDKVSLKLPNIPALYGSDSIQEHYDFIHGLADETLDIVSLIFDHPDQPRKIL